MSSSGVREAFPGLPIRLLISPPLGRNRKSANLHHLAGEANGDVLVISDSDIRVTPDYLRRVVEPLAEARIGVVTCLYRSQPPRRLAAVLEALYLNLCFVPSAVVGSRTPGVRYGFGAHPGPAAGGSPGAVEAMRPSAIIWPTIIRSRGGLGSWDCGSHSPITWSST